jgi:hypothetical protein
MKEEGIVVNNKRCGGGEWGRKNNIRIVQNDERYWALFNMALYKFLLNLLNVLVQI